jgi:hypothetical protein
MGRRLRLASSTTAGVFGGLSLLALFGSIPLEVLIPQSSPGSTGSVVSGAAWFAFGLSFTAVGVVVARRQPRNPLGWLLIAITLAVQAGSNASGYAYFDYTVHHGALPLVPWRCC